MRILIAIPALLILGACNVSKEGNAVTIQYDQNKAENTAADIGNTAQNIGNDIGNRPDAVTATHDRRRAAVEFYHPFRVEEHVRILRRLPLQTEAPAYNRRVVLTDVTQEVTP